MQNTLRGVQNLIRQGNCRILHNYREENQVANVLAKWGIGRQDLIVTTPNNFHIPAKGP